MNEFLAVLLADQAAGHHRTAADYEAQFPRLRGRIASELRALVAGEPEPRLPLIPEVVLATEIARGGQGIVYRGLQPYLDRVVAVKVLASAVADASFTSRFRREARALAGLTHPNIVTCFQAGVTEAGQCYIVMEFVDGPTLRTWLAEHGAMPPLQAVAVARDLALALAHAHAAGIVHRDVKPENVLLQPLAEPAADGFPFRPKLVDLGLVRPLRLDQFATQATPVGMVVGTPQTMAPEQFDDPDHVDHRADIYGLGCVLHHALTGRSAFDGVRMTAMIAAKSARLGPDPRKHSPDVPAPLASLVRRMIARSPANRPATYAALIAELERLLAAGAPQPGSAPVHDHPTRRRVLLAAPLLLAAAASGYWWRTSGGAASATPATATAVPVVLFDAGENPFASWQITEGAGFLDDAPSLNMAPGPATARHDLPRNAFVLQGRIAPQGRFAEGRDQPVTRTGLCIEFGDASAVQLELLPTPVGYRAVWQRRTRAAGTTGRWDPVGEPCEGTWSREQPLRFAVRLDAGTLTGDIDGGGAGRTVRHDGLRGAPSLVLFVENGMTSFPGFTCEGS